MIDPRVSEIMAEMKDVRLTWDRVLRGLDLAAYNASCGGRWSRGARGEGGVLR